MHCSGSYVTILLNKSVKLTDSSTAILGKGVLFLLIASSISIRRQSDDSVRSMPADLTAGKRFPIDKYLGLNFFFFVFVLMCGRIADQAGFIFQAWLAGFRFFDPMLIVGRLIRSGSISLSCLSIGNSAIWWTRKSGHHWIFFNLPAWRKLSQHEDNLVDCKKWPILDEERYKRGVPERMSYISGKQ